MRLRGRVKTHGLFSVLPPRRPHCRWPEGGPHAGTQLERRYRGGGPQGEENAAKGRGVALGEADQAGHAEGQVQVPREVQLRNQRAAQGPGLPQEIGQEKEGVLEQLLRRIAREAREVQRHAELEESDGRGGEQGLHR